MNYENRDFLNIINIASFVLGILNLQENLTQSDKQDILDGLNKESDLLLSEVHQHLQIQDEKIDKILTLLQELKK